MATAPSSTARSNLAVRTVCVKMTVVKPFENRRAAVRERSGSKQSAKVSDNRQDGSQKGKDYKIFRRTGAAFRSTFGALTWIQAANENPCLSPVLFSASGALNRHLVKSHIHLRTELTAFFSYELAGMTRLAAHSELGGKCYSFAGPRVHEYSSQFVTLMGQFAGPSAFTLRNRLEAVATHPCYPQAQRKRLPHRITSMRTIAWTAHFVIPTPICISAHTLLLQSCDCTISPSL